MPTFKELARACHGHFGLISDLSIIPVANYGIVVLREADPSSLDGIVTTNTFRSSADILRNVEFERREGNGLINFPVMLSWKRFRTKRSLMKLDINCLSLASDKVAGIVPIEDE